MDAARDKRQLPIVLALAALLAASGCGTETHASRAASGQPARKLGPHYFICPSGAPVIGVRGRYFPAIYPRRPRPLVRPDRCFTSAAAARQAGYRLAPPPAGDLVIGGLYLVPAASSVRAYCRRAAAKVGFPVPCPTLVPAPADSVGACTGLRSCFTRGLFYLEGNFIGPTGYLGAGGSAGHLWFLAAAPAKLAAIECCDGSSEKRDVRVRGHEARWVSYPPGSEINSGHVLLEWRERGVVYAVSLHGHSQLNRRLGVVLAEHLRMVRGI